MDNESNKVSLEKSGNDFEGNDNSDNSNGYQGNPYNTGEENKNMGAYGNDGNMGGSWNNAGYQDINGQGASKSTFSPSGFAIASLVLGILSLVCCCFWYVSGIFAVLGLIFSIIVLAKHKPGRGMAIAGLICSAIGLIIAVIMGIMVVYIGMNMSADDYKKIIEQINSME